jgi:hypothetical protein
MKLSDIIAYKNLLDDHTPVNGVLTINHWLSPVLDLVTANKIQLLNLTDQINQNYKDILSGVDNYEQTIDRIKEELDLLIEQVEPAYFEESLRLYSQEIIKDSPENVLARRLTLNDDAEKFVTGRIISYGNWLYSGMIINPGRDDWINHLVSCDPLYLVASCQELLDPAVLRFNDQYQRRLRTYIINEQINDPILTNLPDNQFSFCLVYNFFNYKPKELVNQYLTEIFDKLKPGGVVAFTFNNCDRAGATKLVERNFMCYTPGRHILAYASDLGFQIKKQYNIDDSNTWVELCKPGVLTSLKGGQSLARILYKDDSYKYTSEEQRNIRHQAADLNINTPIELKQMPIGQIVDLIKQRKNKL